jgi:predicted unusual protein kinase regulating ubiquinone biosynthesis (AarF/ABC1/UbiB family)
MALGRLGAEKRPDRPPASCRPDVLPPPVMAELARVQDKIAPFSTEEARRVVEQVRTARCRGAARRQRARPAPLAP